MNPDSEKHVSAAEPGAPSAMKGEVSGAFLLGIAGSFYNLRVLPQGTLIPGEAEIDPAQWYPYEMLKNVFDTIDRIFPASTSYNLLVRAGISFMRIWYEQGPGKTLVHSTMDWLRANSESQAYYTVVRGGTPDEIGWHLMLSMDEARGVTVQETVMVFPPAYVRGVLYGGCLFFDDMDFVDVDERHEPFPANPAFTRTLVTVRFRPRPPGVPADLGERLARLEPWEKVDLTPEEVESLVWRYRRVLFREHMDNAYYHDINAVLADAIDKGEIRKRELEAARLAAESANRAKSTFLANMSHELRTPLNAILGYAQMMLRERAPDAPDAETLRIINRSGEHLLGLINSVLDLAKIESHKYTLEPEDFDLGQFLRELVDIIRRRADDKGITLAVDQTSSFPRYVRTDKNKLRQVLINIVGNAMKFTPTGGVSIRLHTAGGVREGGAGRLLFEVHDTGPGIHPEDIERIFRPFEQAKHRSNVEGTGLGLPLAREFVRLMGGDVRVESEVGRGSTFVFDIAFTPVDEAAIRKLEAPPPGDIIRVEGASGLRILVVEDHPENRVLLRRILAPFGFEIAEAEDGEVGVRKAREWNPHLILMDRRMPVMDGAEATRRIRKLPGGDKVRIAAVTAEAFREDYDNMMSAGCDAFVRKPYKIDEILSCIGALLPVELVRATPADVPPAVSKEDFEKYARDAFAPLPADCIAKLRVACASADVDRIVALLAPYPDATSAAAHYLKDFRMDLIASLLPAA